MSERAFWGRALVDGAMRDGVLVTVRGGRFERVDPAAAPAAGAERVAGWMVPGFVDLHVHGGDGADFMDGEVEAGRRVARFHARHGTAALAATTLSAGREAVAAAVRAAGRVASEPAAGEAAIAGIHLEGPYLHPDRAGAQEPSALRLPDRGELAEWIAAAGDLPLIATVAPELPGALDLIRHHAGRVRFSVGHTTAGLDETAAAFAAGARHVTHLFNAMPGLHHRDPGPVAAAAAADEVTVEVIADGVHLHPAILALCGQLFAPRLCLITDAMRACGLAAGTYRLHRHQVRVAGGAARLADGTLAGSVLTMAQAVRNMVAATGLPLAAVVAWATSVPAAALGVGDRKGCLAAGRAADLVVLDEELAVERVLVRGDEVEPATEAGGAP